MNVASSPNLPESQLDQNLNVSPTTTWRRKNEIADYYACDIRTITNLMRRRILPYVKIGRIVRFDVGACDGAMRKYQRRSVVI